MKNRLILISIVITLLLLTGCRGEEFMTLRGRVIDDITGEGLAGVGVEIGDIDLKTNSSGGFILEDIPVVEDIPLKERLIKVGVPGYRTFVEELILEEGDKNIDIRLRPSRVRNFFFVSDKDGSKSIYLGDIYGGERTKLTDSNSNDWSPAWSEKRGEILFLSDRDGNSNIYTMKEDGSNLRQITSNKGDKESPIWLSDDKIAFVANFEGEFHIYSMNLNGDNLLRLTNNNHYDGQIDYSDIRGSIVYISQTTGEDKVHLMDKSGRGKILLSQSFGNDSDPSWSKDGGEFVFVTSTSESSGIYKMNYNGSGLRNLLESKDESYQYPVWNAELNTLIYVSKKDGTKDINLLTPKGEIRGILVDEDINYSKPIWKD
ncbi:DUF5050 domain-containing protein [Halonatronum saccharophilum]|uniref:DUF5050 domain-containing protein n=1 Tax=Halonatronum saccharophilum TaxID=150060 RepID=UPI000487025A|nr:DUF5050 domain-containing protein [Halonatronum saccharophilum]